MLHFSSVTYTYPHGAAPAVRDISFSLAPGEVLLCTGRSGCGKSTLTRLANGLAPHYMKGNLQGEVRVAGQSTRETTPADLAHTAGTLFQDPERQFFALTVGDELALSLQWRGLEPEAVREAVARSAAILGIEALLDHTIFGLSEGQKQKVALASLLATQPKMLVLDEPSANLDPESTAELARTLAVLKSQGIALFIVDHRLSWLRGLADRVMVLENGQCVAQGTFSLLDDDALRTRHGLRASTVPDPRPTLPEKPQHTADALFACRDITFAYPKGKPVFENAAYGFQQGDIIALLGDNGIGKTTLARLFTGLERPQSGHVLVRGAAVKPRRLVNHAQVVLQNAGHQLRMNSVATELADAICANSGSGENSDIVQKCMEQYGIAHLADRHPQSLSGGEKQRLAVACATIRRPEVLILDEPTSGLDGENMQRMAESIEQASQNGTCVLVITHDLELMKRVCTCKLVLSKSA